MNNLQIFDSPDFGQIRTIQQNGEPWFVGKDVADILGYQNGSRDVNRHVDEDDRQNYQNGTFESNRGLTIINESGLYSLILSSKMPKAKEFKRWVTSEVIPAIRKTGGYIAGSENMTDAEIMEEERLPLELWRKIYNQRECKANKQLICYRLCAVLQLTNRFYDLESLEYVEENEYESHVYAKFAHGSGIVVTSMDNSWGMIVDIIKQLPET